MPHVFHKVSKLSKLFVNTFRHSLKWYEIMQYQTQLALCRGGLWQGVLQNPSMTGRLRKDFQFQNIFTFMSIFSLPLPVSEEIILYFSLCCHVPFQFLIYYQGRLVHKGDWGDVLPRGKENVQAQHPLSRVNDEM